MPVNEVSPGSRSLVWDLGHFVLRTVQTTECSLLVLSCDAYSDLWKPFFNLLGANWPDCPMQIYLGAEELEFRHPDVVTLLAGRGKDWSRGVIFYLEQLKTPYVLLMLEDFFLRSPVSNSEIKSCLEFAASNAATQVRLIPRPKPTRRIDNQRIIGESEKGSPYRLCTQAAIWNRVELIGLLRVGESIWEFERNGNLRCQNLNSGFYSVWKPVLPYGGLLAHHVVEKGNWLWHQKWIFGRKSIGCDFTRRPVLPFGRTVIYHLANGTDRALDVFPWKVKAVIKRRLKVILKPIFPRILDRLGKPPARSDKAAPMANRNL
jgi:hypothetical protein